MIYGVEFQTSTTGDHHGNFERHRNCNLDRSGTGYRPSPLFRCPHQMSKERLTEPDYKALWQQMCERCDELDKKLAQLEQEPVAWKLVPIEPTFEMLKAMDECSTEGYDERLYAGHAASVYMAAVDVAPSPPQRTWVGLTDEEIKALSSWWPSYDQMPALMVLAKDIQNLLKDKNAGR